MVDSSEPETSGSAVESRPVCQRPRRPGLGRESTTEAAKIKGRRAWSVKRRYLHTSFFFSGRLEPHLRSVVYGCWVAASNLSPAIRQRLGSLGYVYS